MLGAFIAASMHSFSDIVDMHHGAMLILMGLLGNVKHLPAVMRKALQRIYLIQPQEWRGLLIADARYPMMLQPTHN